MDTLPIRAHAMGKKGRSLALQKHSSAVTIWAATCTLLNADNPEDKNGR